MSQSRLPGTTPAPAAARKQHKEAVRRVRLLEEDEEAATDALAEVRKALKRARGELKRAENDLDASEDLTE